MLTLESGSSWKLWADQRVRSPHMASNPSPAPASGVAMVLGLTLRQVHPPLPHSRAAPAC